MNAGIAATPGGIERQEAEGQRRLTETFNRLPHTYGSLEPFPRETLERLGFRFPNGIPVAADRTDLFVPCEPPPGWSLRPTDHPMHSDIVDDQGRKRGSVFYKAAFYDRRADFTLMPRFAADRECDDKPFKEASQRWVVRDFATGTVLFETGWHRIADEAYPGGLSEMDQVEKAALDDCRAWLAEHFPDHQNVEAYW